MNCDPSDALVTELPDAVESFFNAVKADGYPEKNSFANKSQPWRSVWEGPKKLPEDGRLLVACPSKICYGTSCKCSLISNITR